MGNTLLKKLQTQTLGKVFRRNFEIPNGYVAIFFEDNCFFRFRYLEEALQNIKTGFSLEKLRKYKPEYFMKGAKLEGPTKEIYLPFGNQVFLVNTNPRIVDSSPRIFSSQDNPPKNIFTDSKTWYQVVNPLMFSLRYFQSGFTKEEIWQNVDRIVTNMTYRILAEHINNACSPEVFRESFERYRIPSEIREEMFRLGINLKISKEGIFEASDTIVQKLIEKYGEGIIFSEEELGKYHEGAKLEENLSLESNKEIQDKDNSLEILEENS